MTRVWIAGQIACALLYLMCFLHLRQRWHERPMFTAYLLACSCATAVQPLLLIGLHPSRFLSLPFSFLRLAVGAECLRLLNWTVLPHERRAALRNTAVSLGVFLAAIAFAQHPAAYPAFPAVPYYFRLYADVGMAGACIAALLHQSSRLLPIAAPHTLLWTLFLGVNVAATISRPETMTDWTFIDLTAKMTQSGLILQSALLRWNPSRPSGEAVHS